MSAVAAVPFDPTLAMGHKQSFTWPGPLAPEPGVPTSSVLGQDFSAISESEASVTPPMGSRSLTSSPPRLSFTPDHRDLKREQERARRDSKLSSRMRRTSSNSSNSFTDSPALLPDVSSSLNMPVYTTGPSSLPMLSESATSMPVHSYMSSYAPPPMDQAPGSHVFSTPYPGSMPTSYNMSMDYPGPYGGSGDYSARSSSSSLSMTPDSGMMYQMPSVLPGAAAGPDTGGHVRVVQSRPKPRCWEHGCNGRQFSTFSNLLRHQREKSGQATKATCPNCGAEFTRTTARNGHMLHDKCKQRRSPSADSLKK